MKEPLVSILICTYNAEKTINWTLNSILDQTYKNYEILILDNDSKDNTLQILQNYQKKDKRIKIFNEWKNLWAYWGLNFLLDNAKWEYIAIQDHDDVWHPIKLEEQVKFLEKKENTKYIWCWSAYLQYYSVSKCWFICRDNENDVEWVPHTSLIFRKTNKRYDTKNDYLWDIYFMKKVLWNWEKVYHMDNRVFLLHYCKENWWNYSDVWFKINKKNIKRYFSVSKISFKTFVDLSYMIICRFLPSKLRNKFSKKIMFATHSVMNQHEIQKNTYCSILLSYI